MVHCRVHKSPPLYPIPGQITPVYGIQPHFFKIHFNSITSSTSVSFSSGLLPSGFSTKILCAFFFSSLRPVTSAHLILLNVVTLMMFDEQTNHEAHHYAFFSILLLLAPNYGPNIFLSTLCSNSSACVLSLT
jgi:hypothetical protein